MIFLHRMKNNETELNKYIFIWSFWVVRINNLLTKNKVLLNCIGQIHEIEIKFTCIIDVLFIYTSTI